MSIDQNEMIEGMNRRFESGTPFMPKIESPARRVYEAFVKHIKAMERGLNKDEAVAFRLATFGGQTIQLHTVGVSGEELIMLIGTTPDGADVQLVQHPSQLSVLLFAQKLAEPEQPRKPIGFLD